MTSTGGRIPAWRRLGLALKHESQSAPAVVELPVSRDDETHVGARDASDGTHDDFQSPVEAAVNGKSSSLGKRKLQTEAAEDYHHQKPKKNRTRDIDHGTHGLAGHDDFLIAHLDNAHVNEPAPSTVVVNSALQPKGDPNYRKKKPKPPKRSKQDRDATAAQVKSVSHDGQTQGKRGPTLLASTENDHTDSAQFLTPQKPTKKTTAKHNSGSPPPTDRRKSVAFTPDTKTDDGNSGQELFKKWVAEQKGTGAVSAPPPVSDFTLHSLIADEERTARRNGQLDKTQQPQSEQVPSTKEPSQDDKPTAKSQISERTKSDKNKQEKAKPEKTKTEKTKSEKTKSEKTKTESPAKSVTPAPQGKKKDPSVYIAYLTQYHLDRNNWKFNKAKQNDVLDNALNIFRIPDEHSEALLQYVAGLQGAGVIERLQERCNTALKELEEADAKMDDAEARKVAQEEAEQERIAKERKRRKTESDIEAFHNHPHSDGYIRRLRRKRAEALLTALGRTAPILPANPRANGINPVPSQIAPKRDSKKRKRRGEVSSDESSSDSSSGEDSSDSESEADRNGSDSDSSSSNEDSDDSDSDSDNDSDGSSSSDSSGSGSE